MKGDGSPHVVIFGGGPAGLTAAWELTARGVPTQILEADPVTLGGIAQTASYKGFRFDIGGHRFFTKAPEVKRVWHEILADDDWLQVERMSRIYYRGKFFNYPLKPLNAFRNLGVWETILCVASYARARVFPTKPERSVEDWVSNRFGRRLYGIFFKTYTEKVWGMPCSEISADWAAQRIKGLSLLTSIKNAVMPQRKPKDGGEVIKTLIEEFEYPKLGPGMMWERAAEQVQEKGAALHMGARVASLLHKDGALVEVRAEGGGEGVFRGTHFISSIPMRELVHILEPPPPPEVLRAADALSYRDFLTVVLVVNRDKLFPDNWIYVHDTSVKLGRVQNFKNWSPYMVPDPEKSALGLEYFCNEGDELWDMADEDLIALGSREIAQLGLADVADIEDGTVVRMRKAYPVYDEHYQTNVGVIRSYLAENLPNLQLVGRNGMHKYNNQDHSMMTALLAARNICGEHWDPWKVNTDAEYHEEEREGADVAGRLVPRALKD
jgi:protoporphyrinogen oxidase